MGKADLNLLGAPVPFSAVRELVSGESVRVAELITHKGPHPLLELGCMSRDAFLHLLKDATMHLAGPNAVALGFGLAVFTPMATGQRTFFVAIDRRVDVSPKTMVVPGLDG